MLKKMEKSFKLTMKIHRAKKAFELTEKICNILENDVRC
jgi:hypothetical protein